MANAAADAANVANNVAGNVVGAGAPNQPGVLDNLTRAFERMSMNSFMQIFSELKPFTGDVSQSIDECINNFDAIRLTGNIPNEQACSRSP